jgi:hypothetical protein
VRRPGEALFFKEKHGYIPLIVLRLWSDVEFLYHHQLLGGVSGWRDRNEL